MSNIILCGRKKKRRIEGDQETTHPWSAEEWGPGPKPAVASSKSCFPFGFLSLLLLFGQAESVSFVGVAVRKLAGDQEASVYRVLICP